MYLLTWKQWFDKVSKESPRCNPFHCFIAMEFLDTVKYIVSILQSRQFLHSLYEEVTEEFSCFQPVEHKETSNLNTLSCLPMQNFTVKRSIEWKGNRWTTTGSSDRFSKHLFFYHKLTSKLHSFFSNSTNNKNNICYWIIEMQLCYNLLLPLQSLLNA